MPLIVSDFGVRLPDSLVNNGWVINIQQPAQEPTVAGEKIEFSPPSLEGVDLSKAVDLTDTLVPGGQSVDPRRFDTFTQSNKNPDYAPFVLLNPNSSYASKLQAPKLSTQFTENTVSETAQELAAQMDENSLDIQFQIEMGMTVEQLAEHFGEIGKQIDQALAAGSISQQEYDDLNNGLTHYTQAITDKAERENATWEVAKQMATGTLAMIQNKASDDEMLTYAQQNRETFQNRIDKYLEETLLFDRSLLAALIQRVRNGEMLNPQDAQGILIQTAQESDT